MTKKPARGSELVNAFLQFQNGGRELATIWPDLAPIVEEFAGRSLASLGIVPRIDASAVNEVVNKSFLRLQRLSDPDATGRFDPSRAQPGISGLRGWLCKVVHSLAVDWSRTYRGGRSLKIRCESSLIANRLPHGARAGSVLDRTVAKVARPDLLPILNDCIAKLPADLQQVVRLRLDEGLSHRQTATLVHLSPKTVGYRLKDAYALLRQMLERGGFDEAWLEREVA